MSENNFFLTNNVELDVIIDISNKLERLPEDHQSDEYKYIVELVQKYLKNNCKHSLVMDSVDIDPDRSQTIVYCCKCGITFTEACMKK